MPSYSITSARVAIVNLGLRQAMPLNVNHTTYLRNHMATQSLSLPLSLMHTHTHTHTQIDTDMFTPIHSSLSLPFLFDSYSLVHRSKHMLASSLSPPLFISLFLSLT